jgi:hypothetical protein
MGLLGNTPEKRKYNIAILIWSSCFIPLICGALLNSEFLMIFGVVTAFVLAPILICAKIRYYSYFYKKLHQTSREKGNEPKEIPLFPIISGFVLTIGGGILYYANRNEETYRLLFGNFTIIGVAVLGYGFYKLLRR